MVLPERISESARNSIETENASARCSELKTNRGLSLDAVAGNPLLCYSSPTNQRPTAPRTASRHLSAQLSMVSKAKVAVLCVLQVVCAALAVLSTDRRRLGGAPRENGNTFASNTLVVGAIDGSLIRICRPADHGGWYCRKNYPAINMQAVVDHRTALRSFSIRCGSMNDQALWNLSGLSTKTTIPAGMHLIGDAGYKIFRHLITPYAEGAAASCPKKKCYNFKLSQTRITVERAFGILKNRFRILLGKVPMKSPHMVIQVVVSWLVLHNLTIKLRDTYRIIGDDPDPAQTSHLSFLDDEDDVSHAQGLAKRSDITEYLFRL